jgi:hypothetical protein
VLTRSAADAGLVNDHGVAALAQVGEECFGQGGFACHPDLKPTYAPSGLAFALQRAISSLVAVSAQPEDRDAPV